MGGGKKGGLFPFWQRSAVVFFYNGEILELFYD